MGLLINRAISSSTMVSRKDPELDGEAVSEDSLRSFDADSRMRHRFFNGRRSGHPFLSLNIDQQGSDLSSTTDNAHVDRNAHQEILRNRDMGFVQGDRETRIRTLYLEKEHLLRRLSSTNAELDRLLGTNNMEEPVVMERGIDEIDAPRISLRNPMMLSGRRYVHALPHRRSSLWNAQSEFAHEGHESYHSLLQSRANAPMTLSEVSASILSAASRSPVLP